VSDQLSREQRDILDHTLHRAPQGMYCGGGKEMEALVEMGLMVCVGRKSFVPEPYYRITQKGREVYGTGMESQH
jgi:hypothetical protein